MVFSRSSIRRKLIFATLLPLCVAILLCWLIGSQLITNHIFRQAQQNVIRDLALAHKIFQDEINHLASVVKVTRMSPDLIQQLDSSRLIRQDKVLQQILQVENLSFLNLIDKNGVVRYRAANPLQQGDLLGGDPMVARALEGEVSSGAQVYSHERLMLENPALAKAAVITVRPTAHARSVAISDEPRGLMLVAVGLTCRRMAIGSYSIANPLTW